MTKHSVKKQVVGWTASKTTEADLKKVKKDGFLSKSAEASSPVMRSFPAQTKAFR
jgi:hypothetical protein